MVKDTLDDADSRPWPQCTRCGLHLATWWVRSPTGRRRKMCTDCAKAAGGKVTALKQKDY